MKTPPPDCDLCPRLLDFRKKNQEKFPDKFNAPVPAFGPVKARLLIAGLAPGLKGANFTGRPFTGDYAGDLLFKTLLKQGFAKGRYDACADDSLRLVDCRIVNAVRCVPPENKPTTQEIQTCRQFFMSDLENMINLRVILALGRIAHDSVLKSFGHTLSKFKFAHQAEHRLTDDIIMVDSYHCSRYNTQTGRLTDDMFESAVSRCRSLVNPV